MFRGRLTRLPFFLRSVAAIIVAALARSAGYDEYGQITRFAAVYLLIGIAALVMQAVFIVKRLHDLGRSGWAYWLSWIPLYNIVFAIELLFEEGESDNGATVA